MKTKFYTASIQYVLAAVLVVFFNFSANAQCGSEGSFTVDNTQLNMPSMAPSTAPAGTTSTGSYMETSACDLPVTITGNMVGGAATNGFFIQSDGQINIDQYGSGSSISTFTYTFSSPVKLNDMRIFDIDKSSTYRDRVVVTVNGGASVTATTTFSDRVEIVSGNGTSSVTVQAKTNSTANTNGGANFSTDMPVTEIKIEYLDLNTTDGLRFINIQGNLTGCCPACVAGTTAPTMETATNFDVSTSTYTIPCGSTTADLSALTASNDPTGTSLTVHSGTPATTANKIDPATAVSPGTYYIAFYDATNDCYSPTTQITVTQETNCCNAGTVAPVVGN